MPSIFLSHTSIDKPFVEKLAKDLKSLGINVWFDKWEIKVGESITWKIEEGIRENEMLGIILSPEALESEWVKTELSSAWVKQMNVKKIVVLPILLRDCNIPLFLSDRLYADFRTNYDDGFSSLAHSLGVKNDELCNVENWRKYKSKRIDWKIYRDLEFHQLVTRIVDRAIDYKWSVWVGSSKNPYSITVSNYKDTNSKEHSCLSIKLDGKTNSYIASRKYEINPNNLRKVDYDTFIGSSVNECEEFIWRNLENYKLDFGNPNGETVYFVEKHVSIGQILSFSKELAVTMRDWNSWYSGDRLNNIT